jgi:purine-nucleoside/S-methyl-5'-thioadenosine phosphorylase / adenosine deaminase
MLILKSRNLSPPRVVHGFFGRQGGVSEGIYGSLNCGPGSGDDRANVIENRRRAMDALGRGTLCTLYQIHSAKAVAVKEPWKVEHSPQADAAVTNVPGIALGVLTADCAPVLFADLEAGVIGAAHAGWKGALDGVTDSAIAAMEKLGAKRERIAAAIGPCIGQASYEVDSRFRVNFVNADAMNAAFFVPNNREGFFRFDLEGYVAMRLRSAGVGMIAAMAADTYRNDGDFYSFRRATHRGEPDYGRELSTIMLRT